MKHFFLLSILLCMGQTVFAQILNVEKSRLKGDSSNYFLGNIGVDLNVNNRSVNDAGQTTTFIGLTANSNTGYISQYHSYLLLGQLQYNAITDQPINSTGYGHFRINWLREHKLSYETFTQVQYDQGRGMDLRWLGGGGIRLRVHDDENTSLYIGIGGMYEREIWEVPLTEDAIRTTNIWKSTNYVASRVKVNENIDFNIIAYYQTGYDFASDFFRHRVSADANIIVKVTNRLSFRTSFNATYENRPVVPIAKFVYSLTNGIQISF